MATQQPLEYVAVDVTDAVQLLDSGVFDVATTKALPVLPHNEPSVRLFHRSAYLLGSTKSAGLPFVRVMDLMMERLPRALKTFISHAPIKPAREKQHHYLIHVSKSGNVHELQTAMRSELELLQSWARSAKDEDVLLEVMSSSADRLSELVIQLASVAESHAQRAIPRNVILGSLHTETTQRPEHVMELAHVARALVQPRETPGAAARRQALIDTGWLDSAGVARELGSQATSNRSQIAAALRKRGKLLGVWVPAEKGFRHPLCQFHDHALLPVMEPLLALLPKGNGSGWSQAQWLHSPHALLDQRTPAELLATEPDRVLAAAKDEYGEDAHARW